MKRLLIICSLLIAGVTSSHAQEHIDAGAAEIVLLGQNVNSYGKDLGLGIDFADLMAE